MGKYFYRVGDAQGKMMEGVLDAPSETHAQKFLKDRNFEILSLKKQHEGFNINAFLARFDTVRATDFNFFIRQMATLLKAGVPMLTCLRALQEEMGDKLLKAAVESITQQVEEGNSFSESASKFPRIFNTLFVSVVRAGEAIGELDVVLARLADVFEKDYQTRSKINAALRYPLLVVSVMFLAFLVATLFIIPRFKDLFSMFGSNLPLPTQILLTISDGMTRFWYLYLLVGAGTIGGIVYHYRTPLGKRFWDGVLLKLFIIRDFLRYGIYSRFARMLGIMLKSGVSILQSLELVAPIVGNTVISDAVLRIKEKVSEGDTVSGQMRREGIFPVLLIQMVYAGETSGKTDELLLQIAEHYDAELDLMTKNLETMIEPILILTLGFFVAAMALGIFLPMWNLYGVIASKAG